MTARELLIETLSHMPPGQVLEDLTSAEAEQRLSGGGHSIAELVAHLSYWQDWFCRRCDGTADPMPSPAARGWPEVVAGSWPEWHQRFAAGLERAAALGDRGDQPIAPPIEFAPLAAYTVRDALVHIAQHNAHHLGQIIVLRQLMGRWPPPAGSWTW